MEIIGRRVMKNEPMGIVGTLIGFGVNYEPFDGGIGHYTTAIVVFGDGTVETYNVRDIVFIQEV